MIRALVVVACLASGARAETVELPRTQARLVLGDGWRALPTKGVVAAYKHDRGALLAVTRADVANPDAWVSDKKQAYVDQVDKGIKAKLAAKKYTRKLVEAGGIPALDVEARRASGATVLMRVLLFRTYALALAIEVPKGADGAAARAIVKAFAPPRTPEHHDD